MSLGRNERRNIRRFKSISEAKLNTVGIAREWFQLVPKNIFDPNIGF